jgi:hypothetical protein
VRLAEGRLVNGVGLIAQDGHRIYHSSAGLPAIALEQARLQ